ncbi:hypothetical protein SVAN01_09423 [Stagonosporopsis vannaccii]|nr:hypothetical protein SVAN01_09423 [Stagonosporopsis vannaccii]
MQLFYVALGIAAWPTALTAALADCQLGANKCDARNASVMICDSKGWKAVENCYKPGSCHVGRAGNAYCDSRIECTPGASHCDAANYVSKICNHQGFWETDRKCAKPGCCDIQDGRALCKAECGAGQRPPAVRFIVEGARNPPKVGEYCQIVNERYCSATHDCIFKCGNNHSLFQERCCKNGKCYYDSASLEPYCA